jgi:hypothetical protein
MSPVSRPQPLRAAPPRPGPKEDAPMPLPSTDNPDLPDPGPPGREAPASPDGDVKPMQPTDPDFQ